MGSALLKVHLPSERQTDHAPPTWQPYFEPSAAGQTILRLIKRAKLFVIQAPDLVRDRLFPCEIWHPAHTGTYPLIVFSHAAGGHRRSATFLCTHLASHGYVIAVLDHSEVIAETWPAVTAK